MYLLGSFAADFSAAVVILSVVVYFWWTSPYDYWRKKNILSITPSFPFGNLGPVFLGRSTFVKTANDFYNKFKTTGYGGIYFMRTPTLVVCQPELIKQILIKDFSTFHDRGINPYDEEKDPFSASLFNLGGERWKILRNKLTPTFTTGKIRGMFPLIYDCTQNFKECIQSQMKTSNSMEFRDMLFRFSTDVIGTTAFGVECNSLKNPKTKIHTLSQEVLQTSARLFIRTVLLSVFPKLVGYLTFARFFPESVTFFTQLMDTTVKHRREKKVERYDFVHLMLKIVDEDEKLFNQDMMTSQAFLFFLAGMDNVANTVGFCLHELAVNEQLQERVYQEVCKVLAEHDGNNCYEAIKKMDLIHRVVDESLRKYTSIGILMRSVTKDKYKIPGTEDEITKDVGVIIPVQSLHHDEEIYPDPHKFDPDRFTDEEKSKRHPYSYLPFGEGPRSCIANRFALMEMRLCLAELIRHFKFSVSPETDLSLEMDPRNFGPTPKRGFWLSVTER